MFNAKTHAVVTTGEAERNYLQKLREVYNHEVDRLNTLRGEEYARTKRSLERQARFYKCISGHDIKDRGAYRG
jgi:hypothetical protein